MKIGGSGKDNGLKKPYRKPTVESRGLKLGVYGDYVGNDDSRGGGDGGHGGGRGGRGGRGGGGGGGGRGGHGF